MVCLNGDSSIPYINKEGCFTVHCNPDCISLFKDENYAVYIQADDEGYPMPFEIFCDDSDGKTWAFDYKKVLESGQVSYYLEDSYII